ncbi:putative RND superfamily exporter protein [Weissella uvarum]|uniref:MMPL family transporter n=1 Tax=Weissella uvarum TaxID=1479233 RepID=UPI001EF762C7|nr:MMPL family transporter [Weissella uvarum]MBM7616804.1 putative RND superfamily exporter protein [Weissella uvarum]
MEKIYATIGRKIHDHSKIFIGLILAITVLLGLGLPKITMDMGNTVFVNDKQPVLKNTETYQKHFGGDSAFVLIEGKQKDNLTHENMAKVAKLEQKFKSIDNITGTTSVVSLLNDQLSNENSNAQGSKMSPQKQAKLQKDIQANLSAKEKKQLSKDIQNILTPEQKQSQQAYVMSLLSSQQQMSLAQGKSIEQVLTSKQQAQVQAYMQKQLNKEQQGQLQQKMFKMLPKVQDMSTPLLRDLILDDNGNVQSAFKDLLPNNGKSVLVKVNTGNKSDMTTYVGMTKSMKQDLKTVDFKHAKIRLAGNPAVMSNIQVQVGHTMTIMMAMALVMMVVVLSLLFKVRRRILALLFVVVSLIWTFGIMGWVGIPITLATMAILPIVIGLGTDFGVQFHNRYEEEYRKTGNSEKSVESSSANMGPAVGVALIVMSLSFLTMLLSKAPMMQMFGVTLAIGVVTSYIVEFVLMFSIQSILDRKNPKLSDKHSSDNWLSKGLGHYAQFVMKHSGVLVIIGIILAGAGFAVESKIPVETDMFKMVPQDMQALKDTKRLQK